MTELHKYFEDLKKIEDVEQDMLKGIVLSPEDDLKITKRLTEAGKILGIDVVDHIIISKDSFYSFKDSNLL
jgi:hypothetical protein